MYPEDRVLVCVLRRARDFLALRDEGWYRIPIQRAPRAIDAVYLAFFVSGAHKAMGVVHSGVHFYARVRGHELRRRRDLIPDESDHPRADQLYFRFALDPFQPKIPAILNPTRRAVAFISTTWDRFWAAQIITDLYRDDPVFVRRD